MVYNPVLIAGAAAWAAAQGLKVIINAIKGNGFMPERFFGSGGMPSAHSSTVCAASAAAFRVCGGDSPVFALAALITIIVVYDALNVRYAAGLHARELNIIRRELKANKLLSEASFKKFSGKDFKELLGHTPAEVLGGIALGILVGVLIPVSI